MNPILARIFRWKALILLNAVYAAAGLLWIILIPYNNAPDENTHFHYSVEFIIQHHRLPVWGVDDLERFRHALSSYNQMPALNYVLYAAGAAAGYKLFGLEMYLGARLVSLAWGLIFLNFLFLAVRELCGNDKNALIAAVAVALIPQVLFSFCYVNADAHSLAIAAILAFALVRFFRTQAALEADSRTPQQPVLCGSLATEGKSEAATISECSRGTLLPRAFVNFFNLNIIFLAAAIGLLFSAKYNYYIYFPCIALIIVRAAVRRTICWKTIWRLAIASALLSLLISGYWFIRNAILYGNPLPLLISEDFFKSIALARDVQPVNRGLNLPALAWMFQNGFIGTTFDSFFAVFGYLNVGFHREIYIILQFIVPLIAFLFILDLLSTGDRPARQMLGWLLLLIFAVMGMHVWASLTYDYQPQGRYEFTILVPVALYAGWAITRLGSLWKHAVFFMIMMIWLFVGANILLARTYADPLKFSVSWAGTDRHFRPANKSLRDAERTEKNNYVTGKINLAGGQTAAFLRVGFPDGFLARYRDFKMELETNEGVITNDWTAIPPEQLVNVTFNRQLNAFEASDYDSSFILPLQNIPATVKGVKIGCRIENRRLYDLE